MITQRRLRHLLLLVEYGHFGRTAAALHISQTALTKSIQALEAELGVVLLDRKRGSLVLTAFGELVVQRSKTLLNAEEDLLREISLLAGLEAGSLRVALGPYPSLISGYPAMARLLARRPKITGGARRRLASGGASGDGARGGPRTGRTDRRSGRRPGRYQLLGQHRGRIFCRPGHPVLAAGRVALPALFEFPWMASRIPARIAATLPCAVGRAGKIDALSGDFIPAVTIDVPMQIADLLAGSDALALSSLTLMERDLEAGNVAMVPTSKIAFQASSGFIYLKDRSLTPAALAYMQEVRAVEKNIVEREEALARRYGDTL